MKIGIFTDPHLTKKVQKIQADWIQSVESSFYSMVEDFKAQKVDAVVCGGDFFDKAMLLASNVKTLMYVLGALNSLQVPVFFLLGNHEIESAEENILEILDVYPHLTPVTATTKYHGLTFIPYSEDPKDHLCDMRDQVVFTHHDIYGSSLAGGRTRAKFGLDPKIFSDARLVINGHIHSKSEFVNVRNIGSLLCGAQGEITYPESPCYYILNSDTLHLEPRKNLHSIHYVTCDAKSVTKVLDHYKNVKTVLRYEYTEDSEIKVFEDLLDKYPNVIRHNLRRLIDYSNVTNGGNGQVASIIDVPAILQRYVMDDGKVTQDMRDEMIAVGKRLLDRGRR